MGHGAEVSRLGHYRILHGGIAARRSRTWAHGARNARRAAPVDRSGLGRRLSIFDGRRLEASAFRKDHADAGGKFAQLRASLRALERAGVSRIGEKDPRLSEQ